MIYTLLMWALLLAVVGPAVIAVIVVGTCFTVAPILQGAMYVGGGAKMVLNNRRARKANR